MIIIILIDLHMTVDFTTMRNFNLLVAFLQLRKVEINMSLKVIQSPDILFLLYNLFPFFLARAADNPTLELPSYFILWLWNWSTMYRQSWIPESGLSLFLRECNDFNILITNNFPQLLYIYGKRRQFHNEFEINHLAKTISTDSLEIITHPFFTLTHKNFYKVPFISKLKIIIFTIK